MPTLRPMTLDDYDAVIALMQACPGLSLREADSREATARYLARNPGLSFVACEKEEIIGGLFCGHDGRRGYLQHLAVSPMHRRRGVGRALIERCLLELEALGIFKTHVDVFYDNLPAQAYWQRRGFARRTDILRYSHVKAGHDNA